MHGQNLLGAGERWNGEFRCMMDGIYVSLVDDSMEIFAASGDVEFMGEQTQQLQLLLLEHT